MKNIIFTTFFTMIVSLVCAQESNDYKPQASFYSIEVGLTGGLLNTSINLSENSLLRGRYFLSERSALRLGLNLSSETDKTNYWESLGSKNKGVHNVMNKSATVNLGYEQHFKGTSRLSSYIGGDVLLGFGRLTEKGDQTNGERYIENYSFNYTESGKTVLGVRGIVGTDYYFAKNLYLGLEIGLSIVKSFSGKTKLTKTENGQTESYEIKSEGSSLEIKPTVVSGIRLGFVF